jgi:hypothetical protein
MGLSAWNGASSAVAILPDQLFRRWVKVASRQFVCHGLECVQGLQAPLAGIATAGLLKVRQSLLAEAAVMPPRTQLQELMQRLRAIADLQGRHGGSPDQPNPNQAHAKSMH